MSRESTSQRVPLEDPNVKMQIKDIEQRNHGHIYVFYVYMRVRIDIIYACTIHI